MNRRECDLYDKVSLHLGHLEQGLDLLLHQACRYGSPLPEGFWFLHSGLERAAKKMRKALDKMVAEPPSRGFKVVDGGDSA